MTTGDGCRFAQPQPTLPRSPHIRPRVGFLLVPNPVERGFVCLVRLGSFLLLLCGLLMCSGVPPLPPPLGVNRRDQYGEHREGGDDGSHCSPPCNGRTLGDGRSCCGRKVARLSSSKTKVPPGLMA